MKGSISFDTHSSLEITLVWGKNIRTNLLGAQYISTTSSIPVYAKEIPELISSLLRFFSLSAVVGSIREDEISISPILLLLSLAQRRMEG